MQYELVPPAINKLLISFVKIKNGLCTSTKMLRKNSINEKISNRMLY